MVLGGRNRLCGVDDGSQLPIHVRLSLHISSSFIVRLRTVVHFGLPNEVTCLFSAAEWLRGDCRELETGIGPGRSYR